MEGLGEAWLALQAALEAAADAEADAVAWCWLLLEDAWCWYEEA